MAEREYTAFFPFGGSGGGALGFQQATARLFGVDARFRVLGGIDFEPHACADFEMLTGVPELCADVDTLTPKALRERFGTTAPDVVFMSPPCKGASGLLSVAKSKTPKYQAMNELALRWTELMLRAWPVPPKLVLLENVPRLKQRAGGMLRKVRSALRAAGYVFQDGFHECGEIGGLAQVRKRYLLVARHASRVPPLLYQPPKKRVRACGEVLGELPLPGDPAAGPMHALPKLSWLNWVRLALIPAGGDWRDLEGVLRDGQPRREVFKRHGVQRWEEPSATVAGSGSNGPSAVADPRVADVLRVVRAFDHGYGVLRWDEPSSTVAGGSQVGQGAYSVADLRFKCEMRAGAYGVMSWEAAAATIRGSFVIGNSPASVADPRKPPRALQVIVAADGTWHRPITPLEKAVLQGLPAVVNGKPLVLSGKSISGWCERVGNMVPPPTARAIGERMLVCLLQADAEGFALAGSDTPVWVERGEEARLA